MKRKILYLFYLPYLLLIYVPYAIVSTLFFGFSAIFLAPILGQRAAGFFCGALWARLLGVFTPIFVKVKGRENINRKQSYVIVANHQSFYDIVLVYGWLGIDIRWVMKQELRKIPGLGIGSEKVGHVFIDRSSAKAALASMEATKKKIVNGTSLVFFPEGTRSNTGELATFKRGAFKMAYDLGLPILPLTISGTRNILPNNSVQLLPGMAKLTIHPPIDISKYPADDMSKLMEEVKKTIGDSLI